MPISRSQRISSLVSVIPDWRHSSGRHQSLSWHWPCHWLREPLQLAFWVCPGVEAAKSRQTIFDFVFESPSFHLTTTFNLALLLLAAVNAVYLHHQSLMELNLSPYTVNLWFDQSHWFWHSEGGQRFWSFHLLLRSDLRVPEIYWRRARQFLCKNCRKKLIEPLSCLLRRVFPLSLLMLWILHCIKSQSGWVKWLRFSSSNSSNRADAASGCFIAISCSIRLDHQCSKRSISSPDQTKVGSICLRSLGFEIAPSCQWLWPLKCADAVSMDDFPCPIRMGNQEIFFGKSL